MSINTKRNIGSVDRTRCVLLISVTVKTSASSDTVCFKSGDRVCFASFIHFVVCLTTGPKPLPKRDLHLVRSSASSFK